MLWNHSYNEWNCSKVQIEQAYHGPQKEHLEREAAVELEHDCTDDEEYVFVEIDVDEVAHLSVAVVPMWEDKWSNLGELANHKVRVLLL